MDLLWKDIRYSLHSLRANPAFALIAILTLALGIGATTAIFSVVNAVLLRPLPFHEADRLVNVWEVNPDLSNTENGVSPANLVEWMKETGTFSQMGASFDWKLSVTGHGEAEEILTGLASRHFFPILGVKPHLGQYLTAKDAQTYAATNWVVLSHQLWQRKFGGDPKVIGKTLNVDGTACTIVGVMPRNFFVPKSRADMWVPYPIPINARGRYLAPIARLAPGVTVEQAQARMNVVARRLSEQFPEYNKGFGVNVKPMFEQVVGDVRRPLLIVMAAVGFLLLIACVNIANLLLSRAMSRGKEMAVRAAVGASRGRLIVQSLTESLVLAFIAAVLGIVIAGWATMLLVRFTPESAMMPRMTEIAVDGRVLGVTMLLTLTTAVLFGLAPALQSSKTDLQTALKSSGRGSTQDRRSKAFRRALVIIEVALATVLLIGAGLMIKSFATLAGVEPGVKRDGVLTGHLVLPPAYNEGERPVRYPKQNAVTARILERVGQLPGVTRVGLINNMPFTTERSASDFTIDGDPIPAAGENPTSDFRTVGGDYYRAMGMPILEGRVFDPKIDRADSPTVFVVNEAFAKRYFSGRNTVGRRLTFDWFGIVKGEIIGVVGNIRFEGLMKEAEPAIYRWYPQDPYGQYSLIIATSVEPETLQAPVARTIREIDPLMPFSNVHTLEQLISGTISRPRFNATMLTLFAALGLVLASIGIYGVLSYSVTQRTQEMGIRMALGADPRDVLRLVVSDGAKVGILGVLAGIAIALPTTRLLSALLHGVEASDPMVFSIVALTLTAVALAASYIPARRATRVDPMLALRPE